MPEAVVRADGTLIHTRHDIGQGRLAWQSVGGTQVGSVGGHGGCLAPDWSADWLRREAVAPLDIWATREHGQPFDRLGTEARAALEGRLKAEPRANTHDPAAGTITVSADRAAAMARVADHFTRLLGDDPALRPLREQYATADNAVPDAGRRAGIAAPLGPGPPGPRWPGGPAARRHGHLHQQLAARPAGGQRPLHPQRRRRCWPGPSPSCSAGCWAPRTTGTSPGRPCR